ncbi:hypothetical protein JTB14_026209 [Gonioctena quinquepunctata]|nr:hypothetical protein JTB14_026209 [Gonioctena quinquepunctata]
MVGETISQILEVLTLYDNLKVTTNPKNCYALSPNLILFQEKYSMWENLKTEIRNINVSVANQSQTIGELEKEVTELKKENSNLKKNLLTISRVQKKKLIYGIEEKDNEITKEVVKELINNKLHVDLDDIEIINTHRFGRKNGSILLELIRNFKKQEIFSKVKNLAETRIRIANDLTREDRDTHKMLLKHQQIAKEKGYATRIHKGALVINGEKYTAQQLENPPNLDIHSPDQTPKIQIPLYHSVPDSPVLEIAAKKEAANPPQLRSRVKSRSSQIEKKRTPS